MNIKTFSQLKQAARGLLINKYWSAISLLMACELMVNLLTVLVSYNVTGYTMTTLIFHSIIGLIASLFYGILSVGIHSFYLNIACGKRFHISDLLLGFKTNSDKAICLHFFSRILPLLPVYLVLGFILQLTFPIIVNGKAALSDDLTAVIGFFVLLFLLFFASLILYFWTSLGFSQCFFLLSDFPDRSTKQILEMSWKLMKGHRLRLFYLYLSFIPMIFAGVVSFGIGLLFVTPYQNMTYTQFYLNLIQCKAAEKMDQQQIEESFPLYIDYQV